MSFIFICFVFYLIGSLPTAYILVKLKHGKNISEEGSGNIGAMNTYDVTDSKSDGIIVLLIDLLKGFIPVIWFVNYSGYDPEMILIPALFLLAGHNFSIWQGLVFQFTNPALKNSESELTFLFSFCSAVCIIILFKHIEPVLTYLKNKKTINNNIH